MNPNPGAIDAVVMISGEGSNLQAIIDAAESGGIGLRNITVISSRADANGLRRAARHGLKSVVVDRSDHATRQKFDEMLLTVVRGLDPDLVVLAGFMHILDKDFVDHYSGRLLNIHPSLLPKYPGLRTHEKALEAGDTRHGCSIHFVSGELDGGPVVARHSVPVLKDDDTDRLSARVQLAEHKLYPEVIGWFASGRLSLVDNIVCLDGQSLNAPVEFATDEA